MADIPPEIRPDVDSTETRDEGKEHLPELVLEEIRKSPEPIDQISGAKKPIAAVKPWNNYTIVIIEGDSPIRVFDEALVPISDLSNTSFSGKISIDWTGLKGAKLDGKSWLTPIVSTPTSIGLSEVPPELQGAAKRRLGKSSTASIDGVDNLLIVNCEVVSDKYIVLLDRDGDYIAFQTQDDKGVVLPPKDWKRINPADKYPDDLKPLAERFLRQSKGYRQLNDTYTAKITDVGVNIIRTDQLDGSPVRSFRIPSVENNIIADPTNPNIIYFCQSANPESITRLDLSGDPSSWSPVEASLPDGIDDIHELQLDPSGHFFIFQSGEHCIFAAKDTLEEVKRVKGLHHVHFNVDHQMQAVDMDGHLVYYEPNFGELVEELDRRKISKLAAGIQIVDIFDLSGAAKKSAEAGAQSLDRLDPARTKYETDFAAILPQATTAEGVLQLRQGLSKLQGVLRGQGLQPAEVAYMTAGIDTQITAKEREFAEQDAQETVRLVRAKLASGLSVSTISEARDALSRARATESLLEGNLRQKLHNIAQELEQQSLELFRQRGGEIIKDIQSVMTRTRADLDGFTSKSQMDDWLEYRYPQLRSHLGSLMRDCPQEADEAYRALSAAREELSALAETFEERFKREYAKVREKAAARTESVVAILAQDVAGLVDRLVTKGFTDRTAAEQYLESSEARKALEAEIDGLAGDSPDIAKELRRAMKVRISNALTDIERGTRTTVADTGQQMVQIGKTRFPKWEAHVKEKGERSADMTFEEDPKSHGPGVKAGEIMGDAAVSIRTSTGVIDKVRLYEGWHDENEWRLGLLSYRGEAIPPAYMSAAEFRAVKKDQTDWAKGGQSTLRKEFEEKRAALKDLYAEREKIGQRTENDGVWKGRYKTEMKRFAEFCAKHHISLLRRIDQIANEPEIEHANGKGYVPEWQSHWVMDTQTEEDLEAMAEALTMQHDLQEGCLNLKGHAGTGKDVRMKMFCAMTGRPYFGIDCTKWTTEFELSEDVMLESADGASQTVKVPSAVLNGIETPGAVVYFNEFNAMPEQAQIFLHALMDEKRSLTLKTSSGRVVRAHPDVLIASSMNPNYPGTFEPQFATRSRMVSVEIGYPPLTRKPEAGDPNPNPIIDSSEALRIARGVDSLADLTYEANPERNEFVKMWNRYVNGIENGAAEPATEQKFDVDTILALVEFAGTLRENFIKVFEKSRDARNALPVTQPVTGRELRRCAYALSKMTPEEKATANPETVARELLGRFFLTHIDKKEDVGKIEAALATWTSKKRVRV